MCHMTPVNQRFKKKLMIQYHETELLVTQKPAKAKTEQRTTLAERCIFISRRKLHYDDVGVDKEILSGAVSAEYTIYAVSRFSFCLVSFYPVEYNISVTKPICDVHVRLIVANIAPHLAHPSLTSLLLPCNDKCILTIFLINLNERWVSLVALRLMSYLSCFTSSSGYDITDNFVGPFHKLE